MARQTQPKSSVAKFAASRDAAVNEFFDHVASVIEQARAHVGRIADLTMCVTYFEIGRMIVEQEQGGKSRAKYGRELLAELSKYLGKRFGKGFSETNLRNARKFYQAYAPSIQQLMTAELGGGAVNQIQQLMTAESVKPEFLRIGRKLTDIFTVSWTHYVVLMRIENTDERRFYEIEAAKQQWTVDDLKRQYNDLLQQKLNE